MIHAYGRKKLLEICKSRVFLSTVGVNGTSESSSKFEFLKKHSFAPEIVSKVASVAPRLKNAEKSDSLLLYLKESGFSTGQLQKVVNYRPQYLSSNLERTIMPKIKVFQDLGYPNEVVAELITKHPWILQRGTQQIFNSLSLLKDLLKSDDKVTNLLKRSARFLAQDLEKSITPNIEFLVNCGIPLDYIIKAMYNFPRLLLTDPKTIKKSVAKADEMGVERSGKMFIHAVRVACGMFQSTWEMKLETFRSVGFSEDDILRVFRQAPNVFSVSSDKIMKVTDFVLACGKYEISCIIKNPTSLCCSIERRYKPRMKILRHLESKKLIKGWPCFGTLYRSTDQVFLKNYVLPYIDEADSNYSIRDLGNLSLS